MFSNSSLIQKTILFGLVLVTIFYFGFSSYAQEPDDLWSVPVNLSNSGGATSPAIVIDAEGVIHVVWQDAYRGSVYSRYDGSQWSSPVSLFFPFSLPVSVSEPGEQAQTDLVVSLIADRAGMVHAFWTDDQDQLFSSYAPAANFGDPGSWSGGTQLAESAVDYEIIEDNSDRIHLAYVRNLESTEYPAGIYHRVSNDSGLSWSLPTLLYESPYFRSLTTADANIDLEVVPSGELIYVSWDNQPRKQVYFTKSTDGGTTWGQFQLIDGPTENNPGAVPMNVQVATYNDDIILFWQDGDQAVGCTQYFQVSSDGGNTWDERQEMLSEISGCPQDLYFFDQNNVLVMMATIQGQVYLLAWDGSQWSDLQPQMELSGFEDPGTYNQVVYDCRQPVQTLEGNLVVVGCDTGTGGDIWLTQRAIGTINDLFPSPSVWTEVETIVTTGTPITDPILLSDSQGRLHLFWVQQESTTTTGSSSNTAREAIYYSRNEDDQWTRPIAVLQSPDGMTRQPAAAIDTNDNLYLVWSGGQSGEIYFSRANGAQATSPTDWIEPLMLPVVRQTGSSPDIRVDADDTIDVVYAIPLNENRGIYVIQSYDGGLSWAEPTLAFDAVQEGFDMVDQAHLVANAAAIYNLTFVNYSLPDINILKELYSTRSTDEGVSWSEAEIVTASSVSWQELINAPNGALHRIWLEEGSYGIIFQHEVSTDFGDAWKIPVSITTLGLPQGDPSITTDPAGQLYLLQIVDSLSKQLNLMNWRWDGSRWLQEENLDLGSLENTQMGAISATATQNGKLAAVFVGSSIDPQLNTLSYYIKYSDREVTLPDGFLSIEQSPTLQPSVTPTSEITPSPSPTLAEPAIPSAGQTPSVTAPNNPWMGLVIGGILAGLIAVIVFVLILIRLRNKSF